MGEEKKMGHKIENIRTEIDKVDDEIAELLAARSALSIEIIEEKKRLEQKAFDPDREKEIVNRLINRYSSKMIRSLVKNVYLEIFKISRGEIK
jgi:3-deoxy-7-phosphoheptulonate synthase/chorismate mutase